MASLRCGVADDVDILQVRSVIDPFSGVARTSTNFTLIANIKDPALCSPNLLCILAASCSTTTRRANPRRE